MVKIYDYELIMCKIVWDWELITCSSKHYEQSQEMAIVTVVTWESSNIFVKPLLTLEMSQKCSTYKNTPFNNRIRILYRVQYIMQIFTAIDINISFLGPFISLFF